jgi:hypothetical protein
MATNPRPLCWRAEGAGWRLYCGNRGLGRVVPDAKYLGVWRIVLDNGQLSDMANLSRCRDAAMAAAGRTLRGGEQQAPDIAA